MPGPLDYLKALRLPGLTSDQPELTPDQRAQADAVTTEQQSHDPAWMKAGRSAVDGLVGFVKGATGLGDQGPSGATATNFGQVLAAGLPLVGGLKGAGLPGMYSRVDAAAEQLPSALHPSKAEGIFRNNAAKEEVDYRGLSDFLKNQQGPKVTKDAIVQHLDAHPMPEIGVKDLGGPRADPLPDGAGGLVYRQGNQPTTYERSSLNVPGGSNYRERLLTLPVDEVKHNPVELEKWYYRTYAQHPTPEVLADPETHRMFEQAIQEGRSSAYQGTIPSTYQSGHWDEPNVLAHSRFDERQLPKSIPTSQAAYDTLAAVPESERTPEQWQQFHTEKNRLYGNEPGPKGRFLQEVQSDWHQQGKEKGYYSDVPKYTDEDHANAFNARDAIQQELLHKYQENLGAGMHPNMRTSQVLDALHMAGAAPEDIARLEQAQNHLMTVHAGRAGGTPPGVPDAPFKETWPDLVLKNHVLDVAGSPDLNWLGFTTGDTQNARYDLSKQIHSLHYEPSTGNLTIHYPPGSGKPKDIFGFDSPDQLENSIGRELSQKLLAQPPKSYMDLQTPEEISAFHENFPGMDPGFFNPTTPAHMLTGDLKMEGRGMKTFYDQKLPSALSKILKPFGGKVELGELPGPPTKFDVKAQHHAGNDSITNAPLSAWEGQVYANGEHVASAIPPTPSGPGAAPGARGDAGDLVPLVAKNPSMNKGVPAWIAHLPPEMKEAILKKGLPLLTLLGLTQTQGNPAPAGAVQGLKDQ